MIMNATKSSIKAMYISELQAMYPYYTEGSRGLELAHEAADAALAGKQRLQGGCWTKALAAHGVNTWTLKKLRGLPA